MSQNITVNKGVRWDGLHSYMKELLNAFGDNMMRKYGIKPHFRHMHRDKARQTIDYNDYISGRGGIAAKPGNSFHQAGLAADLDWPQIQAFFNKRPDLQKAYGNNFWNFLNAELAEVGLHRPLGMKDRPHIQPIENSEYHRRVNHRALMSSRGSWDVGGAPFEIGQAQIRDNTEGFTVEQVRRLLGFSQPQVQSEGLSIDQMRQLLGNEGGRISTTFRTNGRIPDTPGMRINNPFNLKHIDGLRPGEIPRSQIPEVRKHATFDTLASGLNAGVRDVVYHKFIKRGINNINDFVNAYLGAAIKNDPRARPEVYKSNLEKMIGIGRNQPIDVRNEDVMVRFLMAILNNETGSGNYIGENNVRAAYRRVMATLR